jgi:glutamate synthase domain-containing protein 2
MAQGAKPGGGRTITWRKVALVAETREFNTICRINITTITDIYSIEDLSQLIFDLNANERSTLTLNCYLK